MLARSSQLFSRVSFLTIPVMFSLQILHMADGCFANCSCVSSVLDFWIWESAIWFFFITGGIVDRRRVKDDIKPAGLHAIVYARHWRMATINMLSLFYFLFKKVVLLDCIWCRWFWQNKLYDVLLLLYCISKEHWCRLVQNINQMHFAQAAADCEINPYKILRSSRLKNTLYIFTATFGFIFIHFIFLVLFNMGVEEKPPYLVNIPPLWCFMADCTICWKFKFKKSVNILNLKTQKMCFGRQSFIDTNTFTVFFCSLSWEAEVDKWKTNRAVRTLNGGPTISCLRL